MKKIGFLALCLLMSISMTFAQKAEITVEKTVYDFGKIAEKDGNVSCDFIIKNTGNAPLVISRVTASCGCTTPEWTKEPIAPGATGTVKATYGAKGRPGPFSKTISVYTNAKEGAYILTIKGDVIPEVQAPEAAYPSEMGDLRLKKSSVVFNNIKNTETRSESIEIYNQGSGPLTIGFAGLPAYIIANTFPQSIPTGASGVITITYVGSKVNDFGSVKSDFNLIINGKKNENKPITVFSIVSEDFSKMTETQLNNAPVIGIDPASMNFDNIKSEKTKTLTITNNGKSNLLIHNIKTTSNAFLIPGGKKEIKPGKSQTFLVKINEKELSNNAAGYIEVASNDPKNSLKRVRVSISVDK